MDVAAQVQIDDTFSQVDMGNIFFSDLEDVVNVGDETWVFAARENNEDIDVAFDATIIQWTSIPDETAVFLDEQKFIHVDDSGNERVAFGVLVRFLEPGSVTIRGTGYSTEPEDTGVDRLSAEYNFSVVSADGSSESTPASLTINQRTAQTNLISACDANQLDNAMDPGAIELQATCDALALLDDQSAALNNVVPDELFSIGDTLVSTTDQQLSNIEARINTVRLGQDKTLDVSRLNITIGDQQLPGAVLTELTNAALISGSGASDDDIATSFENSNLGTFVSGNVSIGEYDGDDVQTDTDFYTSVLTLGADYRLNSRQVIGAALSFESDNTGFAANDGELDMQGFGITAFGTWYKEDKGYADLIVNLSQNNFDIRRRINLPGNADEFAKGSSNATRIALSVNLGRTIQRGASEFGPLASVSFMHASVGGFTETSTLATNGAGTALKVASQSITSGRLGAGGEFKQVINTSKAVLVPYVKLLLDFETQTEKDAIIATFVNDTNASSMRFIGAKRDVSSLLFSVGTTAVFIGDQSAFVTVETRLLDERVSQTQVQLGYRRQF